MLNLKPRDEPKRVNDRERKLELLLDLGTMLSDEVELDKLLTIFGERVAAALDADRATLWLFEAESDRLRSRVANLPELTELTVSVDHGIVGHIARTGEVVNIDDVERDGRWASSVDVRTGYTTRNMLGAPLLHRGEIIGVIQVLNREGGFHKADEAFLKTLCTQIAGALQHTTLRSGSMGSLEFRGPLNHVVGASPAMEQVYAATCKVAPTDASVLLVGETGTGKGLFARAIHVNSRRRSGPLITLDCTNLPATLVESELFGHERGAYTGAERTVPGKLELAAGGTLFIDELGELPIALQGKLLRFLQERVFERVGGRDTLHADVRVVAATNRDLATMVREGSFRSDLYYRIRVVEIELPTLRERGDSDILSLAEHFVQRFSRDYACQAHLSREARKALVAHPWPGNVRELEHAIERAVVLSDGVIAAADLGLQRSVACPSDVLQVPRGLHLEEACAVYAQDAVERAAGNRTQAARTLQIGRNRLARLLKR